jgi:hypothetical protein
MATLDTTFGVDVTARRATVDAAARWRLFELAPDRRLWGTR